MPPERVANDEMRETNDGSCLDTKEQEENMVLIYESDPLDNEDARGRFYHVCRGRIDRTEIRLPEGQSIYECAVCGVDLEPEDFWIARQKGSV